MDFGHVALTVGAPLVATLWAAFIADRVSSRRRLVRVETRIEADTQMLRGIQSELIELRADVRSLTSLMLARKR